MDLPRAIDRAIEDTYRLIGNRPVTVIAEYPAHFPSVEGEAGKLARVIACLVSNAARLVEKSEVTVRAELLAAGEPPQTVPTLIGISEPLRDGGPWAVVRVSFLSGLPSEELAARLELPPPANREFSYRDCREVVEGYNNRM